MLNFKKKDLKDFYLKFKAFVAFRKWQKETVKEIVRKCGKKFKKMLILQHKQTNKKTIKESLD